MSCWVYLCRPLCSSRTSSIDGLFSRPGPHSAISSLSRRVQLTHYAEEYIMPKGVYTVASL